MTMTEDLLALATSWEEASARLYQEEPADFDQELAESEPLTTTTLSWTLRRLDSYGLVTDHEYMGWSHPTAFYAAKNGYFTIHDTKVQA